MKRGELLFSICTPTFNRAKLLSRVYNSLLDQSFRGFEWVVVDDGSSDETSELVNGWIAEDKLNIKYFYQENAGKSRAVNQGVKLSSGQLFIVFDSDDWCDSDALDRFRNEWLALGPGDREQYLGLSCLKRDRSENIVGDDYTRLPKLGCTYIDRLNKGIRGDKWECIRTDLHASVSYPVAENEKYMAPSYVWLTLAARGYRTVFINEPLSTIEYQSDGISSNNIIHRAKNAVSTYTYYRDIGELPGLSKKNQVRMHINASRFALHQGDATEASKHPVYFVLAFPLYVYDVLKIRRRQPDGS